MCRLLSLKYFSFHSFNMNLKFLCVGGVHTNICENENSYKRKNRNTVPKHRTKLKKDLCYQRTEQPHNSNKSQCLHSRPYYNNAQTLSGFWLAKMLLWGLVFDAGLWGVSVLASEAPLLSRQQPPARPEKPEVEELRPGFDDSTDTHIFNSVGRVTYLHCRVNHLGDRVVTWLRQRDGHILTVGLFSYTTDQRFTALHADGSPDWVLKITSAQVRDSGIYECQVSTEPKISKPFNLTIIETIARLEDPKDIHMSAGNALNLTCTAQFIGDAPSLVYWFRNGEALHPSTHTEVQIKTLGESSSSSSLSSSWTSWGSKFAKTSSWKKKVSRSQLVIKKMDTEYSGNYTCAPDNAKPASVTVYVHKGEHPAAMQHGGVGSAIPDASLLLLHIFLLLLFLIPLHFPLSYATSPLGPKFR
ncbi:uncharacterized protein LOC143036045 [Oratosquilla oratoria]|uniref:uncharacterized protein LOC143036045 n=1 Tax=Oratosquilla oratoria TaxID=337810 RepID=UPI003F75D1D1